MFSLATCIGLSPTSSLNSETKEKQCILIKETRRHRLRRPGALHRPLAHCGRELGALHSLRRRRGDLRLPGERGLRAAPSGVDVRGSLSLRFAIFEEKNDGPVVKTTDCRILDR